MMGMGMFGMFEGGFGGHEEESFNPDEGKYSFSAYIKVKPSEGQKIRRVFCPNEEALCSQVKMPL
jgi:hypothetical protein